MPGFFGVATLSELPGRPVRRIVAATRFGPAWPAVLAAFTTKGRDYLVAELSRRYKIEAKGNGALARFLALEAGQHDVTGTVVPLLVDKSWAQPDGQEQLGMEAGMTPERTGLSLGP
jgi:hypothetical protein